MKIMALTLLVFAAGCASSPKPDTEKKNISFVSTVTQSCQFVRRAKCESIRENGDRRCYKRLEKKAEKEGIDTIVVESVVESSDVIQLDNNTFGDKRIIVEARFYRCDVEPTNE